MNVISYRRECECGCGGLTRLDRDGVPRRFVHGHNNRGERNARWRGDQAGYVAIHSWVKRRYPKTGICVSCGASRYTEYAFLHHPAKHTRNRDDYVELCKPCHERLDKGGKPGWAALLTHCKRGHEFTFENTYVIPTTGSRQCRACARLLYDRSRKHTIAAEAKLGRKLRPGEIVRHLDGDKSNNDPANLVVMTRASLMRVIGIGIPGVRPIHEPWKKRWERCK